MPCGGQASGSNLKSLRAICSPLPSRPLQARYLTDANILSCLGRWHPCLPAFRGFGRVAAHGDRFPVSNIALKTDKEPFTKYTSNHSARLITLDPSNTPQ